MPSKIVRKVKRPKATVSRMGSLEKFRRMATVIQDSNDAITFQDLDGNILAWNRGAEQIYGYSEAEALNMNIVDTVPKEYQKEAREFLASLKRGELVSTLETKRKTKNGRIVDVWLTNTKLTDDKGKLTGIATTERDITERKHSEASLNEKFRELSYLREGQIALSECMRGEQIISHLGRSILSHLVPFTNAQLGAFYKVTDEKKLQQVSSYALAKSEDQSRLIEFGEGLIGQVALERHILLIENVPGGYFSKVESGLGQLAPRSLLICPILYENEVTAVIELGSLFPFTEHQRAFLIHVSENIGIAINTSDVRKKVQKQNEALNKAQVLLEEKANEVQRASRYKTEFLANMSHELRTPLNSSLILAKLLMDNQKENLTAEQVQYAASIYSSSKDLLNLINDILDLSKVEAGKLEIRSEKVDFDDVLQGLKQTFQSLAQEKNLDLQVSEEPGLPAEFHTDRQRLNQILKNLISNAIKFTLAGSVKVRIYSTPTGNVAFEVSDTGIGIPKVQQSLIFDAFHQADGTSNRKFGGTGLGLSISRDLAKLLGGSIGVESHEGKGSVFTLTVPRLLTEVSAADEVSPEPIFRKETGSNKHSPKHPPLPFEDDRANLGVGDKTFLVIEDDIIFAKILMDQIHGLNFKALIGQGADEGFQMALEYAPNAILLDMKLPDHLGLTVLDRLKENPKTRHIPVFAMSIEDFKRTSLRMGAVGFLLKPVRPEEIQQAIEKLQKTFSQKIKKVLIVENDEVKGKNIGKLLSDVDLEITHVTQAKESLASVDPQIFDCLIMNLRPQQTACFKILDKMVLEFGAAMPPVIVYLETALSLEQKDALRRLTNTIVIKEARSPETLVDEVSLVLHRVESKMSEPQKRMIKAVRNRDQVFEGRKILLVDDDIRNIFAMTSALEDKGATIFVGRNGQEALDKLEEDPAIDLVLMDIMMPEMDGYEATRRIRKQKRFAKLPIIAVTAKAMAEDQQKCLDAGTTDYVSKPVDFDKLQSLIRVWMTQ